ncbi:MAG: aquaporin family protein [Chloroflexi bacterium]|nr:aquaporin family protein [Chloroflexota bacterium]
MARDLRTRGIQGELIAEIIGTFIFFTIGNGAVAIAVLTGGIDVLGVGVMWGLGVMLGAYAVGATSGAHLNPAVTIGLAIFKGFAWVKVLPYIIAQLLGGFLSAAVVYLGWHGVIKAFEASEGITRGEAGSQLSGMIFYTNTPNPAAIGTNQAAWDQVPLWTGFLVEAIATMILVAGVMYLTDLANTGRPLANLAPVIIGTLIGALVIFAAPLTMSSFNPARDFGPRIFAAIAGWGSMAIPGPRSDFGVPTLGPIVGGVVGGALYTYLIRPFYPLAGEPGLIAEDAELRAHAVHEE